MEPGYLQYLPGKKQGQRKISNGERHVSKSYISGHKAAGTVQLQFSCCFLHCHASAHAGGMVHQYFKLVECFSVLDNIILGVEPVQRGLWREKTIHRIIFDLTLKKSGYIISA